MGRVVGVVRYSSSRSCAVAAPAVAMPHRAAGPRMSLSKRRSPAAASRMPFLLPNRQRQSTEGIINRAGYTGETCPLLGTVSRLYEVACPGVRGLCSAAYWQCGFIFTQLQIRP